jgi:hypothetical protein
MILMMASGTPYWEASDCDGISTTPAPLSAQEKRDATLPLDILANRSSILWDFPFLQPEGAGPEKNLAKYYSKVAPISGQVLRVA